MNRDARPGRRSLRSRVLVAVAVTVLVVTGWSAAAHAQSAVTPEPAATAATGATVDDDTGSSSADAGSNAGASAGATAGNQAQATTNGEDDNTFSIDVGLPGQEEPSQGIVIIILITLLSVAPSLLIMLTSFTRIVIVLSLTRNALGLQTIPPNQVIVGLALFLSLFVMGPTLSEVNESAIQPYLKGEQTQSEAWENAQGPIREFMLDQTRGDELETMIAASGAQKPATPDDVSMNALIPAFILSELKTAFIIGFVVFIPFLVIDLVVSSSLMSMGMMMLPPSLVSLPFKMLLFVLVDGWGLVVTSLLTSFN
jgi:flagellar biosynthetic protein FliP